MALETGTYISDLVVTNPPGTDLKSQGDDHLRLIKSTIKTTFPNISGAVTTTHTRLNYVGLRAGPTLQEITTDTTLAASTAGSYVVSNLGTGAVTVTLPLLSSVDIGASYIIDHSSSAMSSFSVAAQGSDTLLASGGSSLSPYSMAQGETLIVIKAGAAWKLSVSNGDKFLTNTGLFASTLAGAGQKKLPGGFIIKWAPISFTGAPGAAQAVTFPAAFPNACLALAIVGDTTNTSNAAAWFDTKTTTGFNLHAMLTSQSVIYIAMGH